MRCACLLAAVTATGCLVPNPNYVGVTEGGFDNTSPVTSSPSAGSDHASDGAVTSTALDLGDFDEGSDFGSDTSFPEDCDPYTAPSCVDGVCKPYLEGPDFWGGAACFPPLDELPPWARCVDNRGGGGPDACDGNGMCWQGQCTPYCQGQPGAGECSAPGTACADFGDGVFGLCIPGCNPIDPSCPMGEACYVDVRPPANHSLQCAPVGVAPAAQICLAPNDCAAGLACVDADQVVGCLGARCCAEYCDVTAAPDLCVAPSVCTPLLGPGAPPSLANLGTCAPP